MKKIYVLSIAVILSLSLSAQTYTVTFNVDMNDSITSGFFTPGTDVLYVTGDHLSWAEPGTDEANQIMTDDDADGVYTLVFPSGVAAGEYGYKYFVNAGWNGGEWPGDPNRIFTVVDADVTLNNVFGANPAALTTISADVKIGPNPTNGLLTVNADANYNVNVIDATGRTIASSTMQNNSTQIDLSNQAAGLYIVRLSNSQGSIQYKIIKK